MSISSDGRVTQWMIRKGFESLDYIKLKRVSGAVAAAPSSTTGSGGAAVVKSAGAAGKKEKGNGFISRHPGGLCFDLWSQDRSMYKPK